MQTTLLPAVTLRDLVEINEASAHRSPGVHVTDIVTAMMRKIDPKRYDRSFDDHDSENWQEAGFLWEDVLSGALASKVKVGGVRFRPGELNRDGVLASPDAIVVDPNYVSPIDGSPATVVDEEYKFTWKSSNQFDFTDKKYLPYLLQAQAYCAVIGTRFVRFHIFHANGDYGAGNPKKRFVPHVRSHFVQFSQREIDEQWTSMLNTARKEGWL